MSTSEHAQFDLTQEQDARGALVALRADRQINCAFHATPAGWAKHRSHTEVGGALGRQAP